MGWRIYDLPNAVVQLPTDDIIIHTLHENCPCDPEVTLVGFSYLAMGDDQERLKIRKLIDHESMDGRDNE